MSINKYTDIDAEFGLNLLSRDLQIKQHGRAIAFQIKNILMTNYGERPFNHDFGASLGNLLFELSGDQLNIVLKKQILTAIENYEPRALVFDIEVNSDTDNNRVYVQVTFKIRNTETVVKTNITLERTR